jgi:uncharacterized sodium:solute symporter family permease YidK
MLFALVIVGVGTTVASAQVDEQSRQAACEGLGAVGNNCSQADGEGSVSSLIGSAVNILSFIVGVAAVIMIIIGGLKYVTSNGDSNAISSAKTTILYALIGLVVALLAQGLVRFVFRRVTTTSLQVAYVQLEKA